MQENKVAKTSSTLKKAENAGENTDDLKIIKMMPN